MKPKGGLLPLLFAIGAMLALPTGAAAKPGYLVIPPSFSVIAHPPKSNGYTLAVASSGRREISVLARRKTEMAIYSARGRANRRGFSADMGRFGHMQMRFQGSARLVDTSEGCKGPPTVEGRGTFHGSLRFRGREGFVSVKAMRIRGRFLHSFRQVCKRQPGEVSVIVVKEGGRKASGRRRVQTDVLEAEAQANGRTTSLRAIRIGLPDLPPFITAAVYETIDHVRVVAFTQSPRRQSSLAFSRRGSDPETAVVRPASPFAGEAALSKPRGGPAEWSGDLRVPLAGYGSVELTGAEFTARACHSRLNRFTDCGSAQGSGSHSQPLALARLSSLR